MKHGFGIISAATIAVSVGSLVQAAPTPVLEYKFNETGTTAPSTGSNTTALRLLNASNVLTDYHGAAASGVNGLASDRALNLTSSTGMGSAGSGPRAAHAADLDPMDSPVSLTLQGWFKTDNTTPIGSAARLFVNNGSQIGYTLLSNASGTIELQASSNFVNATSVVSSASFGATQSWVFFAVTMDLTKSSSNVRFYVGSPTSAVAAAGTGNVSFLPANLNANGGLTNDTEILSVGNRNDFVRPLDGHLDNLRVFIAKGAGDSSGALTQAELETIRQADITIPEPTSLTAMGLGMLALAGARRMRRA